MLGVNGVGTAMHVAPIGARLGSASGALGCDLWGRCAGCGKGCGYAVRYGYGYDYDYGCRIGTVRCEREVTWSASAYGSDHGHRGVGLGCTRQRLAPDHSRLRAAAPSLAGP